MSSPWTPGPWIRRSDDKIHATIGKVSVPVAMPITPYRRGVGLWRGLDEFDANSNIISASPDLYESLSECLAYISKRSVLLDHRLHIWATTTDRARAALKKARGGK